MKSGRQTSLTTRTSPAKAKAAFRPIHPDPRKSSSPVRLRSMSPLLVVSKPKDRPESPDHPKKREENARFRPSPSQLRRTLGDLGKVDLRRGTFSNKQIVAPGSASLNVSVIDMSPGKLGDRTPSPTATRSVRCQQLSKGFTITRSALIESVGSVSRRLMKMTPGKATNSGL